MKYVLESNNETLRIFREELPMTKESEDRIKRCDMFPLREVVLAHYEINPFHQGPLRDGKLKYMDFVSFTEQADAFFLTDLFRRSQLAGEVSCLNWHGIVEPVKKDVYVKWASSKGLPLPASLIANIRCWEPPKLGIVKDVQKIDFDGVSSPVLAALGANVFAQAGKRANPQIKMSEICKSNLMRKFLEDCAIGEDKELRAPDTIREYIEWQFPK